jgi:hypothetical protein
VKAARTIVSSYRRARLNAYRNISVGDGTEIRRTAEIDNWGHIEIGDNCRIDDYARVRPQGGEITIGDNSSVNHFTMLNGAGGVNYPDLPRWGLPGPRLLRSGRPDSVSELVPDVSTVVPDSAGGFPLQAVRSVPLLPVRHSATTAVARFLSRLNNAGDVASISLPHSTAGVVTVATTVFANCAGAVSPPYSAPFDRSVEQEE